MFLSQTFCFLAKHLMGFASQNPLFLQGREAVKKNIYFLKEPQSQYQIIDFETESISDKSLWRYLCVSDREIGYL